MPRKRIRFSPHFKFAAIMKELIAKSIAARVKDGETIGLGSGTTAELAVVEIGKRIRSEGLLVRGVPTSARIALIAAQNGIAVLSPMSAPETDWAFDGADEVDPELRLIKGRGAAMLLEKVAAVRTKKFSVLVTEEKLVTSLGSKFPVPIEVVPAALMHVQNQLIKLGAASVVLRESNTKYGPEITENGNLIIDASFRQIPHGFEQTLKTIVGVIETGIFETQAHEVLSAGKDGVTVFSRMASGIAVSKLP